jgi:hypothetical protein
MKKLFEVRAEVVAFILAEDAFEAELGASAALQAELDSVPGAEVREVTHRSWSHQGWSRDSLVYGADDEVTLGSCLDLLPERKR